MSDLSLLYSRVYSFPCHDYLIPYVAIYIIFGSLISAFSSTLTLMFEC